MDLKGRLRLIANKIPECNMVCDIGTDHAYIPIYLVEKNICKKAIAADVKKGPLFAAQRNIRESKLEERIETRLGSGLESIRAGEADVIVIAGMGGELIKEILSNGFTKAKTAKSLVLQPMNSIEVTREWLNKNGFEIYDEEMVNEGEKIYTVISANWTGITRSIPDINYLVGEKLIERNDPLLKKFLLKKLHQLDKIINELADYGEKSGQIAESQKSIRDEIYNVFVSIGGREHEC